LIFLKTNLHSQHKICCVNAGKKFLFEIVPWEGDFDTSREALNNLLFALGVFDFSKASLR
jgi:hypothetical protein